MKHVFTLIFLVQLSYFYVYCQEHENSNDSIYLLNINGKYKLKVLEYYDDTVSTPYRCIDFPKTNYFSKTKTLKLFSKYDNFETNDSSLALVRIEFWADWSYGSGGYGRLLQIPISNQLTVIDNFVNVDSISDIGVFYLTIEKQKIKLLVGEEYTFISHTEKKEKEYLLDYISEYFIKNEGYISRIIE